MAMDEQLCLFDSVSDNGIASLTDIVSDAQVKKQQAIQKYLDRAGKESIACVNKYSPGRRSTEYYRLSYRISKKRVKHIHIRGGSTIAQLATYRAKKIQQLIDRGAELSEILAAVATFNGHVLSKSTLTQKLTDGS